MLRHVAKTAETSGKEPEYKLPKYKLPNSIKAQAQPADLLGKFSIRSNSSPALLGGFRSLGINSQLILTLSCPYSTGERSGSSIIYCRESINCKANYVPNSKLHCLANTVKDQKSEVKRQKLSDTECCQKSNTRSQILIASQLLNADKYQSHGTEYHWISNHYYEYQPFSKYFVSTFADQGFEQDLGGRIISSQQTSDPFAMSTRTINFSP